MLRLRFSSSAACVESNGLRVWKLATQQTEKSAPRTTRPRLMATADKNMKNPLGISFRAPASSSAVTEPAQSPLSPESRTKHSANSTRLALPKAATPLRCVAAVQDAPAPEAHSWNFAKRLGCVMAVCKDLAVAFQ